MAQNPVLTQLQCSPAGANFTVRMTWQPIQGQTYFYAAVFDAMGVAVVHQVVNGTTGNVVAMFNNVPLSGTVAYTARVAQCDQLGNLTSSYSPPLNVLQNALTNVLTVNDLDAVAVSAVLPTVGAPSGIAAQLIDQSGKLVVATYFAGSNGVVVPPAPLSPTQTYTLYLQPSANNGLSTGGSQPSPLQMTAPAIGAISYDGTTLEIDAATAMTGTTTLLGALLADGARVQQGTGDATTVSLAVASASLILSSTYACTLRAVTGGNTGPASPALAVVVAPPQIQSAYFVDGHAGAVWTVPPIAPVPTGAVLSAASNGGPVGTPQTTLGYRGDIDLSGATIANSLSIQARSVFGVAKGPAATVDLPFQAPAVTAVSATPQGVAVAWTDAGNAGGYRLRLNDAGNVAVQTAEVGALTGGLPLPPNGRAAYTVSVQPSKTVGGVVILGPTSATVPLLASAPAATGTSNDGTKVTVTWTAPVQTAGITGYEAVLLDAATLQPTGASQTAGPSATSADVTATLDAGSRVVAAVRATGAGSTGPLGPAVDVIAGAPTVLASEVGATSLHVAWTPVPSPAVTGYRVTISDPADPAATQHWDASGTTLDVPNTITAGMTNVSVVAKGAQATGPASITANLFGSDPSFYPQATSDARPWLIRATTNQPAATDLVFAFPDLFTSAPATLPSAGIFVLEANAASATLPYKLTIPAASVAWAFDAASRATLAANFLEFLKKMEMPDGTNVLIKPGALVTVRQSLALGLPLLFSEQLHYMYGFDPDPQTGGFVDLVPGMRLRVDGEVQQVTPPANNQTGNVPIGSATYEVQSYPQGASLQTGFNAFLSVLGRPVVPTPLTQPNAGGGGIIDLYNAAGRQPYFRLLYPSQIRDPKFSGLVDQSVQPVILGAATYNALVAATAQYVAQGNFTGISNIYPFYFRGRATLTPEISVGLNGRRSWIALGSTVANLIAPMGAQPVCVQAAVGGFTMRRSIGSLSAAVTAASVSTTAVATNRVRLEYPTATFSPTQPGYFGLPLFGGDDVRLDQGGPD